MIDWTFRISSVAAFCADLDGFCTAYGYPLLTVDDGAGGRTLPSCTIPASRFDFDVIADIGGKGPHVNARGTSVDGDQAALDLLGSRIESFFASLPTVTNTSPAPYTGTQTWHTTGNTELIPAVAVPKRVWA